MNRILYTFVLLCLAHVAFATHNRAGEITYEQIGPLTVRATVTTYTKTSSFAADRDSLTVYWGDGTSTTAARVVKVPLQNDIQFNQYVAVHTYPGNAVYFISMIDPNRNGGILNVNFPFSDQIQFFLQTEVRFLNQQFQGNNSSPLLLQPPVDVGCVGKVFQHTPNAWDPDGDSIAYELATPLQSVNSPVPNYVFVDQISPGPLNNYTFDPVTGMFIWDAPQQAGEYNIAMLVKSYRNGILIGTILRDMQILILNCNSSPPTIQVPPDLCVQAGDVVDFDVVGMDADLSDLVTLSATGGPFQVATSPATLTDVTNPGNPARATFHWNTSCEHIQDQYYQIAFKAQDDSQADTSGLATFGIVRIRVMGPPPQNLTATPASGQVELCWDAPYVCQNSTLFRGFTVWRKNFCDPSPTNPCRSGLEAMGYTRISPSNITALAPNGRYCFTDVNIQRGALYTYAVEGEFAPLSPGGFPYNPVPGLPSEQICIQTARDIPLLTNADVTQTDAATGQIFVQWSKPKAADLDTVLNPGPYRYVLYRSNGFTGANTLVTSFFSPTFAGANDTSFTDVNLNTAGTAYNYKVGFYVQNNELLGETLTASSIYLTVAPTDNACNLSWSYVVPWGNYLFEIYRRDPGAGTYALIGQTTDSTYFDTGLTNGEEYCYYIKATGTYNIAGILDPLFNRSQEACAIPRDNVPPCPPPFTVTGCDPTDQVSPEDALRNLIEWTHPGACGADIERFTIYYSPSLLDSFQPVGVVLNGEPLLFQHLPEVGNLAGCYYLTATDSVENFQNVVSGGNESAASDTICVDNCPLYNLPNAFTPNGDNANEVFKPFMPYRFIERIHFQVYNRWGQRIFETTDPSIGWDGTDQSTGEQMAEGVYFYTCEVYEKHLDGAVRRPDLLSGYIHLVLGR